MQSTILTRNRRRLAHGAAILLFAGMSAGCSSDLMRFDHGLSSNNSAQQPVYAQQQPAPVYQDPQAYPGDYASAQPDYLDQTTTASVNRTSPVVRSDRRGPVPSVNVGSAALAPRQPFPQQSAPVRSAGVQQLPAPVTPGVARQPLAAPAPDNLDRTVTGSIQSQPVKAPAAPKAPVAAPPPTESENEARQRTDRTARRIDVFKQGRIVVPGSGEIACIITDWSENGARQMRMARALRAGQVFINNYGAGGGVELPFGGTGKSGHGREKGFEALYGFSVLKTVAAHHG